MYGQNINYSLPTDIEKKLSRQRWFKDFEKQIGLPDMPQLEKWYHQRQAGLNAGEDYPDLKWRKTIAILGVLHNKFWSVDIPLPDSWIQGWSNCRTHYTLSDIGDIDYLEMTRLDEGFSNPQKQEDKSWYLRNNLAAEFADLFLDELRKVAGSITDKSTTEEILQRNAELRKLLNEAMRFNSVALSGAFYEKLPDFLNEIKADKDPALNYVLENLEYKFVNHDFLNEWESILKLFGTYFGYLADAAKPEDKKICKTIEAEVLQYMSGLLAENKKLRRKIQQWQGDS